MPRNLTAFFQLALTLVLAPPLLAAEKQSEFIVNFPTTNDPVAEIVYTAKNANGKSFKARKLTSGSFTLPKNVVLKIEIRPGAVTSPNLLQQLSPGLVAHLSGQATEIGDEQFAHCRDFHRLKKLSLRGTDITDKSLPLVGTFTDLIELGLDATLIDGSNFSALLPLKKLQELNLSGTNLQPGSLVKLKPLFPSLEKIVIEKCRLNRADMQSLANLANASEIRLAGNKIVNDDTLKYLSQLKKLHILGLEDTSVTVKVLETLKKMPALKRIVIRDKQLNSVNYKKICPQITIIDPVEQRDVPVEIFAPLH